jgi:hypothetical protein
MNNTRILLRSSQGNLAFVLKAEAFEIWKSGNHLLREQPDYGTEGARTQRALVRGTAKRLEEKPAKPRPMGRVLGRFSSLKIRGFLTRP